MTSSPKGQKWRDFAAKMDALGVLPVSTLAGSPPDEDPPQPAVKQESDRAGRIILGPWAGGYSQRRAAHLTGLSQNTVSRWISGHDGRADGRRVDPVVVRSSSGPLTFLDVAELAVLAAFRRAGVGLGTLRVAAQAAIETFGTTSHPFCAHQLLTDGSRVFAKVATNQEGADFALLDLVRRQGGIAEVIGPMLEQFDFEAGATLPRRWWPMGKSGGVVIDPEREHGEPIVSKSGVPTVVLIANEDEAAEQIAAWYEVDVSEVRAAERYERHLRQLRRGA